MAGEMETARYNCKEQGISRYYCDKYTDTQTLLSDTKNAQKIN